MEPQNQEIVASGSPAEVPNDPGKMFIGGLSWQTSPDYYGDSSGLDLIMQLSGRRGGGEKGKRGAEKDITFVNRNEADNRIF
ncbi:hypothetical protein DMN91_005884 [Ooceraea biroi]|uniref:Uncharacterized protein n=1 Tax=Ooceraea biroi TaxID=2015173 RepID=A0A3L8DMA8_OOCBI|nr:hypothetical protein DMN91_005884 [Ooceraea biroi]